MNFAAPYIIDLFKKTNGAISVHEGCALHWLTSQCPEGAAVELGSHEGKAAIMEAAGFYIFSKREFHLVDPAYDMTNREAWENSCQGTPENAHQHFNDPDFNKRVVNRVFGAGIFKTTSYLDDGVQVTTPESKVQPILHGDYSLHAIPEIQSPFAYCMVDSDIHGYELCRDECNLLRYRMAVGGIIAFHDFMSQFLGVEQAYREMLQGGMYEEVGIPWGEIKEFVKTIGGESGNTSWHHVDKEAPCFLGALRRVK